MEDVKRYPNKEKMLPFSEAKDKLIDAFGVKGAVATVALHNHFEREGYDVDALYINCDVPEFTDGSDFLDPHWRKPLFGYIFDGDEVVGYPAVISIDLGAVTPAEPS